MDTWDWTSRDTPVDDGSYGGTGGLGTVVWVPQVFFRYFGFRPVTILKLVLAALCLATFSGIRKLVGYYSLMSEGTGSYRTHSSLLAGSGEERISLPEGGVRPLQCGRVRGRRRRLLPRTALQHRPLRVQGVKGGYRNRTRHTTPHIDLPYTHTTNLSFCPPVLCF